MGTTVVGGDSLDFAQRSGRCSSTTSTCRSRTSTSREQAISNHAKLLRIMRTFFTAQLSYSTGYLAVSKVLAREFFTSDYVIMSCSFHFSVAFLFRQ
jgi:hypothetical protein